MPGGESNPRSAKERKRQGCSAPCRRPPTTGTATCPEPHLIRAAARILQADRELTGACLDELAAGEGIAGEPAPASDDAMASTVPAGYLVPFRRAGAPSPAGPQTAYLHRQEDQPTRRRIPPEGCHKDAKSSGGCQAGALACWSSADATQITARRTHRDSIRPASAAVTGEVSFWAAVTAIYTNCAWA